MEEKIENVPNQHLANVFKKQNVGENRNNEMDSSDNEPPFLPKSIGGIELKNYKEGEYNGFEEYENE